MTQLFLRSFTRRLARAVVCLALAAVSTGAFALDPDALPTGGQVAAGSASVSQSGASITVTQASNNAIINWSSFNIGASETVNFIQPSASSTVLNRVTGGDRSQIYGQLLSNGRVWLLSPAGILVGTGERIDTASMPLSNVPTPDGQTWTIGFSGVRAGPQASLAGAAEADGSGTEFDALVLQQADRTRTGIPFQPGWNLVGNGGQTGFDVATLFGEPGTLNRVVSVWKWNAAASRWAFYSPTLTHEELLAYAQRTGYDVLERIEGGEGFWLNASHGFVALLPEAAPIAAAALRARLATGWNLVSVGEHKTPAELDAALASASGADLATPPAPATVTSVWAWDNQRANWYFHAPELAKSGGLAGYIAGKSYIDFTAANKTLGPGVGFWVNKPADKIPLTITATGINTVYGDAAQVIFSDNRVAGDSLEITAASVKFSDQNVGVGKTISVTGITVTGRDADKYTYNTTATATADITRRTLAVSGFIGDKIYDGSAVGTFGTTTGLVTGDTVSLTASGAFNYRNVDAGKTVSAADIALTGAAAGNYVLTFQNAGTLTIGARSVTLTSSGAALPTATYSLTAVPASSAQPTATSVQP